MRLGRNPYKGEAGRTAAYCPRDVTAAMLTFVPTNSGYFAERFETLKLSLASLVAHTEGEYDLMVLDNGSHQDVRNYLLDLHRRELITWLILSERNLGVLGGLSVLLQAAPGTYVAYSDDDVFFHPGWLEAALQIHDRFPSVAYVSGCPAHHNVDSYNASTLDLPTRFPVVQCVSGAWKEDWDRRYAASIGASVDYIEKNREKRVPLFEAGGVRAWAVSTHFQFVARRSALAGVLPLPRTRNAMASSLSDLSANLPAVFDGRLDDQGFARLTTEVPFTEHLGNHTTEHMRSLAERYNLALNQESASKPFARTLEREPGLLGWLGLKVLNLPGAGELVSWVHDRTFALQVWKQAQDRRKVAMRARSDDQ